MAGAKRCPVASWVALGGDGSSRRDTSVLVMIWGGLGEKFINIDCRLAHGMFRLSIMFSSSKYFENIVIESPGKSKVLPPEALTTEARLL